MRIISGKYKGRIIKMPKGIRPTQEKVRKALFDILGDIEGSSLLELFAGSGAVGLEALSQGAKEVVFVEKNRRCREKIKENLSVIGLLPTCRTGRSYRVIGLDAFEAIRQLSQKDDKFDIIFLDPPYYKGMSPRLRSGSMASVGESLTKKTLQTLSAYDILSPNGFILVQHFKKDNLPDRIENLTIIKQARYGDTVLSFYRKMS